MLNDLSTMKAVKKKGLFMAALCLFFAALFLLLLPGGVARAEEETGIQDVPAVQDIGAGQLDTASLITAEDTPVLNVGGWDITEDGYWITDTAGTMIKVTKEAHWNVAYNKDSNTLTLNGATIKGKVQSLDGQEVIVGILDTTDNDLNIEVKGTNTVTCNDDAKMLIGIGVKQNLTLTGTGSLKVTTAATSGAINIGIVSEQGLEINGPDVTAISGGAATVSEGVLSFTGLNMISGTLTAVGGKATGTIENYPMSAGIQCNDLTITSGTIDAAGGMADYDSYGIDCRNSMTVNGGAISASAGESAGASMGISTKELKMIDGAIDAVSSTAFDFSFGLATGSITDNNGIEGSTEISGGQIRATANIDTNQKNTLGVGMLARGSFTMTGGEVTAAVQGQADNGIGLGWYPSAQGDSLNMAGGTMTATATGSYKASIGVNLYKYNDSYGNLNLSGGSITAMGGPADLKSYGVNASSSGSKLIVSGGSLTATADQAKDKSIGVGFEKITITGGSVIAKGAAATRSSALKKEPDVSGYDAYHWRVAEGDAFANKPLVYQETTYFEIQPGALAEAAVVTNPPTGLDAQSNLLMMGAGLCLTAVILWVGYSLYKKSQF